MDDQEQAAIVSIALMAAAADGSQSAQERAQLRAVAARGASVDLEAVSKQVAAGLNLADAAARLSSDAARHRAYEAALVVCNADGPANQAEEKFLSELQAALGLAPAALQPLEHGIRTLANAATSAPPTVATSERLPADSTLDDVILKQAMLTGALEILPDNLASLAILPVQLRLVYLVGQQYGQQLDANQVKDLAGTLGIGAAAQLVEGVVRKVLGGLTSGVLGGLLGGATGLAAGAAVSFASTYALGHVAKQYYAQGRRLSTEDLRTLFVRFQGEAKGLLPKVQSQIQNLAGSLNLQDVVEQLRLR